MIGGHEGIATIGLATLVAIPPNSHAVLQWAMAGGRVATSLPRDKQIQEQNKTLLKNEKQNGVNGRRLRLGLVFCHGAHTREDTGTRRRGLKLK